ncbi:PREDICTED: interferon alpha/beta receptor 2 isoform X2 [Gekko japonicus]|uniref:Interferon alpha/beta receptor 2 isoform X2 n=1 Tax=Gekko japonicus TaxID=146911 RepID=A0ABM1JZE6_GEKJA|nr:PREDICTED: interferon alpha/beta receptor 2 isoform X2 [Gekko japonicus]
MMMAFFMGPLHFYRFVYISTMTSVLYSIPGTSVSPLNLTIKRQNFEYSLSWEAGNNTRAPTYYNVKYFIWGECLITSKQDEQESSSINSADCFQNIKECSNITHLFCNLTKEFTDPSKTYVIALTTFPEHAANYSGYLFTPYSDTCLGPPEFNISTCSSCVNVTVKILSSLLNVYKRMEYTIKVKAVNFEEQDIVYANTTERESFYTVFEGLHQNRNYCVSVDTSSSASKKCVPSPWKCIVISSKDKSDYVIPVICGIFLSLAVGMIVWLQYYMAGSGDLKSKERPKVLEPTQKLNYSLFDSPPEEVHTIQMIQERGKTFGENSYDGESSNEKDAIYTNRRPLGTISKSHSKTDIEDTVSIGCSSTASDCQTAEMLDVEAEDSQYDIKKEDSATDQMFYPSSDMNSSSLPEPEGGGCLNINLDTVKLEVPNTNWEALATQISFQEDTSDLQEPCDPDASEPKHFANRVDTQRSDILDMSPTWQNYSGSEESESSDSEMVGEYMRR